MSVFDSALTPVTQNVRDFSGIVPKDTFGQRTFSEQLTDYVESVDAIRSTQRDEERERRGLKQYLGPAVASGLVGAGAGAVKGLLWDRGVGASMAPVVGTFAGLGAASSLLYNVLRSNLRNRLRESSYRTVMETPAVIRDVYRFPELQQRVRDFGQTRWLPWRMMEGGALLGGLGALAGGWLANTDKGKNVALTAGGSIAGAGAGAVLGYLLRERRRKQLLTSITDDIGQPPSAS